MTWTSGARLSPSQKRKDSRARGLLTEIRTVPQREEKKQGKAQGWRLVPIGYLVECFEERAAILQFEAGLKRKDAEREAEAIHAKRFRVYELVIEG